MVANKFYIFLIIFLIVSMEPAFAIESGSVLSGNNGYLNHDVCVSSDNAIEPAEESDLSQNSERIEDPTPSVLVVPDGGIEYPNPSTDLGDEVGVIEYTQPSMPSSVDIEGYYPVGDVEGIVKEPWYRPVGLIAVGVVVDLVLAPVATLLGVWCPMVGPSVVALVTPQVLASYMPQRSGKMIATQILIEMAILTIFFSMIVPKLLAPAPVAPAAAPVAPVAPLVAPVAPVAPLAPAAGPVAPLAAPVAPLLGLNAPMCPVAAMDYIQTLLAADGIPVFRFGTFIQAIQVLVNDQRVVPNRAPFEDLVGRAFASNGDLLHVIVNATFTAGPLENTTAFFNSLTPDTRAHLMLGFITGINNQKLSNSAITMGTNLWVNLWCSGAIDRFLDQMIRLKGDRSLSYLFTLKELKTSLFAWIQHLGQASLGKLKLFFDSFTADEIEKMVSVPGNPIEMWVYAFLVMDNTRREQLLDILTVKHSIRDFTSALMPILDGLCKWRYLSLNMSFPILRVLVINAPHDVAGRLLNKLPREQQQRVLMDISPEVTIEHFASILGYLNIQNSFGHVAPDDATYLFGLIENRRIEEFVKILRQLEGPTAAAMLNKKAEANNTEASQIGYVLVAVDRQHWLLMSSFVNEELRKDITIADIIINNIIINNIIINNMIITNILITLILSSIVLDYI